MFRLQTYSAIDNDWATHVEMVVNEARGEQEDSIELLCRSEHPIRFVLAAISTPEGNVPHDPNAEVAILDRNGRAIPSADDAGATEGAPSRFVVFNEPEDRNWLIVARGSAPYAVSAMAFHPSASPAGLRVPAPAVPLTCRICKSTAKALALAIVAVATYPAIPAALIAAVASFLGVAALAAAAFINSVLGDVASVIAKKLCRAVGLCP